jgi:hypothetical protein
MMGRQDRDQRQLFYEFSLDEMIPADHLLRRINVFATAVLGLTVTVHSIDDYGRSLDRTAAAEGGSASFSS